VASRTIMSMPTHSTTSATQRALSGVPVISVPPSDDHQYRRRTRGKLIAGAMSFPAGTRLYW
jgi:hypothetical protein